ncbi:MAG: sugar-transfer associated ATP-grasp domain-containing protein [Sphaerochaetaceae bacterium]|nr:sugar-transfer associated ATP-grasp domain-containing protein [Sphaerochaetaceae bacterium]
MNVIESMISKVYSYRSYVNHRKNLADKLDNLKSKNALKSHPLREKVLSNNSHWLHKSDLGWFDYFFSVNGIASETYMPHWPYYLIIEPTLNHRLMVSTLKDKNFYELFFKEVSHPLIYARRINGHYYNLDYQRIGGFEGVLKALKGVESFILKASLDSGGGQSIFLFKRDSKSYKCDRIEFNDSFLRSFSHDFVIQETVRQHSFYQDFNPSSNNTLRILVYRSVVDDSINVLHTLLRIGKKGSYLDHDNQGGVSLYIHGDGRLSELAYDNNGNAYPAFNGIVFSEMEVAPYYKEAVIAAQKIASKSYYGRLLALDFTVAESGEVQLLDVNCWRNGVSHYQIHSGTLFGDFTSEIVNYCTKNPSFNIIRIFPKAIN